MFIMKRKHDAIVANLHARIWSESDLAVRYMADRDAETKRANGLAAELATLRADAEKHQRSRANLKQFRKAAPVTAVTADGIPWKPSA